MLNLSKLQKPIVMLFLLCLLPLGAMAQNIIKGTVTDNTGEPVIGASVRVQGAKTGTLTDISGNYRIEASAKSTLTFNYVGYIQQTVAVNGRNTVDVVLEEDNTTLNDVVVIGYGTQKKSDLTGAIASVKGDEIKNLTTTDAGAALQGKVSGVQIINSGAPGAGAQVRVRGYSSNSDKLDPLFIVDGLKVDNIQYLDPSMIESMEVLKDAASAAIYGAQAGNGVVLITTRNGKASDGKASVTYSLKAACQSLGKKADLFNAKEYIAYHEYLGDLTQEELDAKGYKGTNTNWYDEVFDNSWSVQHNVTVQGGNQKGHFFIDLGLLNNNGIVKGDKDVYKRFSVQLNADYKFYKWLQVTSNTSFEKWSTRSVGNGYQSFLNSVVSIDPLTPAYVYNVDDMGMNMKNRWLDPTLPNHGDVMTAPGYTDEKPIWYGTSKYIEDATGNPLAMRDRINAVSKGINVRGNLAANITPIDGLVFTSRLGYRISQGNGHDYTGPFWLSSMAQSNKYTISANTDASLFYQWENFVNYNKTFGKHNVGAMIGMSFTRNHRDNTSNSSSDTNPILNGDAAPNYRYIDFLNANGLAHVTPHNLPNDNTELAYFGRLTYSYDNRYFVQFNMRRDAFDLSRLSKAERWGSFPSFSAGWTISNEKFFKNLVDAKAFSYLKLRASWGRNGSIGPLQDYLYNSTVGIGGYYHFNDTAVPGASSTVLANPSLTWEVSQQVDLGLDAHFLNSRLTFGLDWYRKVTKDLLIKISPFPELGFSSETVNSGEVLNSGLEFELGWRDKIGDLKYSVNTNFSTLKNEVRSVTGMLPRITAVGIDGFNNKLKPTFEAGHQVWYFRGYKYAGVDRETGRPTYRAKDGSITDAPTEDDKMDIGSGIPDFTYGITLHAEYKGFDLTVFGTGASGNEIYNLMVSADRPKINGIDTYWRSSWKQPGDVTKYPDMKVVSTDWTFFSSSAAVFDGSYFKFKQIQLGYTVPAKYTKFAHINALRFSVSLDDFFTITKYPGADPETSSLNGGSSRGFDNGNYPMSKKVVLGVNVTF